MCNSPNAIGIAGIIVVQEVLIRGLVVEIATHIDVFFTLLFSPFARHSYTVE
jgi:hypothetical protein